MSYTSRQNHCSLFWRDPNTPCLRYSRLNTHHIEILGSKFLLLVHGSQCKVVLGVNAGWYYCVPLKFCHEKTLQTFNAFRGELWIDFREFRIPTSHVLPHFRCDEHAAQHDRSPITPSRYSPVTVFVFEFQVICSSDKKNMSDEHYVRFIKRST